MATYDKDIDYEREETFFKLKEHVVYGSSRVGIRTHDIDLLGLQNQGFSMRSVHYSIGSRQYELSNHLGNVLSVVSDKVIPNFDHGVIAEMWADIRVAQDYSPFGVTLSKRNFSVSEGYRYGFNGYEGDPEVKGQGNSYTTEFRQYDPRLGRWLSLDPEFKIREFISPYNFVQNSPLLRTDLKGNVDDKYTVDENGNTELVEKTDEKFDMLYTKKDWNNKEFKKGIQVKDQNILKGLSKPQSEKNMKLDKDRMIIAYFVDGDKDAILKVFKYLAENTKIEWSVSIGNNFTKLATYYDEYKSPSPSHIGVLDKDVIQTIHNHPNQITTNEKIEIKTMGYLNGKYVISPSDWDNTMKLYNENNNKLPYKYNVYFPLSRRLYNVSPNTGGQFEKNIYSPNDF